MKLTINYFIDSQKGLTFAAILAMMAIYNQWENPTAWVYLALHGTYGWLWILKSSIFPDEQWHKPTSLWFGLVSWAALCLYWIAPWLLTSRGVQAPPWLMALCISLYAGGVFLHFASDMQKYISLRLRPGQLFTDGLWSKVRNPNYLGELLIYLGFGLLAMHWLSIAVLLLWIFGFWIPNMLRKDRVLAQLEGFDEYKRRSKRFIPFVF
jgi:protein-S-isoprenylcysteine O-methyltransferase Ste14